ncbi:hypothetical protein [Flavobacterium frigidarium]|uniref:Uncharacterized protein n=1 Tax=Flavobacterium frigidarium TaxID=99286 RepID=A0ABV4KBK3_9FLAO
MEDYKNFKHFLESVRSNELYAIKLELAAMIILLNGSHQKINEAIAYAQTNSDFDFETHQPSQSKKSLITVEDSFLYENGELSNNFSQERLNEVFRLYHLMCNERDVVNEIDETKKKDFKGSNSTKKVVIVAGVVVTAYFLYKILK